MNLQGTSDLSASAGSPDACSGELSNLDAVDARRYRWLRAQIKQGADMPSIYIGVDSVRHVGRWGLGGAEADSAIDAAIAGDSKEPTLLAALASLCRNFPTDSDLIAAGWDGIDVSSACKAYDEARAVIAKATASAPSAKAADPKESA